MQPPLLIKNFNHHPIHGTDWEVYNFWPCWYVCQKNATVKHLHFFLSKGASCIENKIFQMKIWPDLSFENATQFDNSRKSKYP